MTKIKILNLIPALSGGGAERQLSYLAPELVRMGHDVHIVYSNEGPEKPELPGVLLYRLKARSNYDPYLFWQLVRFIRRIKPDIIHTWIMQMDSLGGIAAKFNGIPWVFREPSSAMAYPANWKYRLRARIGSGARAVVSNSRGGDEYWKTYLPDDRRYLISNGLPVQEIDRTPAALPAGLTQSEAPIVLYVGRLSSDITATKNLRAFLEVLARVRQKQKVAGVLCGEGPQRSELKALRHTLGLETALNFTGHLPAASVWALMKKAAVFVFLSAYEGCPNAVMEAMACGCPLVLSDIPAHRALLGSDSALFVDPENIQETVETILLALRDMDTAKVRALAAKQKTREWSIAGMARNWERVYQECIRI
jgi:glycosyltransferase involved in cell wall biosynthesis